MILTIKYMKPNLTDHSLKGRGGKSIYLHYDTDDMRYFITASSKLSPCT